jgi:hypothetical protein
MMCEISRTTDLARELIRTKPRLLVAAVEMNDQEKHWIVPMLTRDAKQLATQTSHSCSLYVWSSQATGGLGA